MKKQKEVKMIKEGAIKIPNNPQYRRLKEFIEENRNKKDFILQILLEAQKIFGYLPEEVQYFIAKETNVPSAKIYGIITFYNFFRTKPIGKYVINVCLGTACHVKGAPRIIETFERCLGIKVGETTEDKLFTLSTARCFGACGLAPVIMINEEVYGKVTPAEIENIIKSIGKRENRR